jgi:hypothetical protein
MAYEKQNFTPGQKLKAAELNHMEEGIVNAVSVTEQTLSEAQKSQARKNLDLDDIAAGNGIEEITIESVGETESNPSENVYQLNFKLDDGSVQSVQFTAPQGPQGLQGLQGPVGTGVSILGSYDSEAALNAAHPSGKSGDAYLVNGNLYVWNCSKWENVGNIQGPKGDPGPQGPAYTLTNADKDAIVAAVKATVTPASIGAAYEPIISTTDITAGSAASSGRPYHVIE